MIQVTVRLFGAFRNKVPSDEVQFNLPGASNLSEVRSAFLTELTKCNPDFTSAELIKHSAFADDSKILNETSRIEKDCTLAILPPVCGG